MSISSTVLEGAEIQFFPPAPGLRPHVGCFWMITARTNAIIRIVPDGTTSISFEQQPAGNLDGYLRGPLLEPVERRFSAPSVLIRVRLRPGVAFNLTGSPTHRITSQRIALAASNALRELDAICTLQPGEVVPALESILSRRLVGTHIHSLVERALAVIHAERGCVSVADLAARCDTSERHLSRLMRHWVGYGPKRYSAIVRFQFTLAEIERTPHLRVAALANESGYFDQSHLSAELSRFAGATPARLAEEHVSDFSKTQCDVPF